MGVGVAVGVTVSVAVAVEVGVAVGEDVAVGVAVLVGMGEAVSVTVGEGVTVTVDEGTAAGEDVPEAVAVGEGRVCSSAARGRATGFGAAGHDRATPTTRTKRTTMTRDKPADFATFSKDKTHSYHHRTQRIRRAP